LGKACTLAAALQVPVLRVGIPNFFHLIDFGFCKEISVKDHLQIDIGKVFLHNSCLQQFIFLGIRGCRRVAAGFALPPQAVNI